MKFVDSLTLNNGVFGLLAMLLIVAPENALAQQRLSTPAQYTKYIDALLQVKDFGIHYYDDGAADATVLIRHSDKVPLDNPPDAVLALVQLGRDSLPLLVDCLDDGRLTAVRFDGNVTTKAMNVPVGYVCLDILMGVTHGKPAHEPDCSDDGLGACIKTPFYFRPDDYYHCWKDRCFVRPWVFAVQRTWRWAFLQKQLRFQNPYEDMPFDEYKQFATPRK
jgi:hypothetical protein